MSNLEDFDEITKAINENSPFSSTDQLIAFYLGCMARHLAQIADTLNEIKEVEK